MPETITLQQLPGQLDAPQCAELKVWMLDLFSIVPYYTAALTAALRKRPSLSVELQATSYYLDAECYRRFGLAPSRGRLDAVSHIRFLPKLVRRVSKVAEYLLNMASLLAAVNWRRPDLVHVQFLPLALFGSRIELVFLRLLRRRGVKIVYTVHNLLPHEPGGGRKELYRTIYSLADSLICHNENARNALEEDFGQARNRIFVIPHGPLLQSRNGSIVEARGRLGLPEDAAIVLWQGIMRSYKGVHFLLDSWPKVAAEAPDALLCIVGTGDDTEQERVRERVAALGIGGSVRLTLRFVSVEELGGYHTAADVLVYPYAEATTSGALMTGAGYGKAIVATRLAAFEELLVDGDNALLTNYGDTAGLASCLVSLIQDRSLRLRLAHKLSRAFHTGPTWDEIAARTEECYRCTMN